LYLLSAKQLKHEKRSLSQNSAAGYWSTFRGLLALAFKEKYLTENLNDSLDKIDTQDTRRQFLTTKEVRMLYKTPCREPVLKAASLFSCLTGLRFSDKNVSTTQIYADLIDEKKRQAAETIKIKPDKKV
jgi:site-specific recombinase XerD